MNLIEAIKTKKTIIRYSSAGYKTTFFPFEQIGELKRFTREDILSEDWKVESKEKEIPSEEIIEEFKLRKKIKGNDGVLSDLLVVRSLLKKIDRKLS